MLRWPTYPPKLKREIKRRVPIKRKYRYQSEYIIYDIACFINFVSCHTKYLSLTIIFKSDSRNDMESRKEISASEEPIDVVTTLSIAFLVVVCTREDKGLRELLRHVGPIPHPNPS